MIPQSVEHLHPTAFKNDPKKYSFRPQVGMVGPQPFIQAKNKTLIGKGRLEGRGGWSIGAGQEEGEAHSL